jgi:hypothetical protein
MQYGTTVAEEAVMMERLIRLASPAHARLRAAPWRMDMTIVAALRAANAELQLIDAANAAGDIVYDSYETDIVAMPPGLSPEAYLAELSSDINLVVNDATFNFINRFTRRPGGPSPAIGDIYDIDIAGPYNGSVMLVDLSPTSFVFHTILTPILGETGEHPEYGCRQFGFEAYGSSIRFFTRGASRGANLLIAELGAVPQEIDWISMMNGIGRELEMRGGRRGRSRHWTTHSW